MTFFVKTITDYQHQVGPTSASAGRVEVRDRQHGPVKLGPAPVSILIFGSQLATARTGRGLRLWMMPQEAFVAGLYRSRTKVLIERGTAFRYR